LYLRGASVEDTLPSWVPVRARDLPEAPIHLVGKAVRAGHAEVSANPRARSAIMRVAARSAGAWREGDA
jgi:16S rRNA (cytosine1402-N4)-methyltransferase